MSEFKVDLQLAKRVLETVDAGLCSGIGKPVPGQMCVEAAVCYAMGLPHGDEPTCVSKAVRSVKIGLNDSIWSSNTTRARGMRKLAIAQLGSKDVIDDIEFVKQLSKMTITKIVPRALRYAASIHPDLIHKQALEYAAVGCEIEGREAASAAAWAAASEAAWAASEAARAARAASEAASEAASVDNELTLFADEVTEILVQMKSPGCEFLYLCEE